jgi:amino acid adenylation domain-containing protein/thioester reductase-like protein
VPAAGQAALPGGRLVGYCIRMLPIRSRLRPGRPFGEHLAEIRRAVLDAAEHQDYSLARLVRRLGGERDPSRPPLVAASFNMDSTARVGVGGQGFLHLAIEEVEVPVESAKLDLGLNLVEEGAGMRATLEFRDDLFRRTTACRWLAAFEALLRAAVGAPGTAVAALPLLAAAEQQQILVEWTDTATDPPGERCLHELLAGAAAARPEAIAVVEGDRQWSRGEIECRAERLAERLRRLGVGPEGLVGLCLERSARMVVALLAVLKAGGAYLPLDPSYPPQRVAFMLADSGALWVLTEERWRPLLAGYAGTLLSLDSLPPAPAAPLPPPRPADPGNRAYVLYTSGSTGRPKGVEVVHRGLTNLLTSMARQPGLGVGDALVAVTTLSFDIAGLELYLPLLTGARLVLARREDAADGARLAALLDRCGATAMQATPATWRLLLAAGWRGRPRLAALCGGEALPRELAGELLERSGALWNLYGPTETTVYSTGERVAPGPGAVPLGRPIANTVLRLLDRGLEPVPLGVVGELYVGGAGLARGYLGQPGLTADRFVPAPLGETTGERLYRTGDLARLRADGTLEFLGRADHQVKLRGVRIELGEIEAVLGETSVVAAAAVAVREVAGDRRLVAYVVPAEAAAVGDPEAWNEALRAALRRRLPGYMIPAAFVHLPALPLTANGKVDRRALPTADAAPPQPPRGGLEQALAGIWCEVLGIAAVGTRESFFEVGGHSLLVPRLLALLRERLGVELSIRGLFATPSVVALAARLADGAEIPAESTDLAELRADVVLDPDLRPRSPRTEGRLTPRALFLTGATGFVGAFLLAELLATTPAEVHCLVRADDEAGARERLRRQLVAYRLWHPWMEPRIVPVPGDLGRPRFGLSPDAFERLAGLLDGIYHCGAWVNFTYPYTMLRASNVGGAREALRLAVAGRLKPVHHISTLGVLAGSPEDGEWREDAPLPAPDGLVEGYAQSKWVAERILQLAQDRGVPVAVYRLGLVGGHSRTGVSNPRDLVWVWLKGMVRMEAATAAMDDLDLAPVDYVCRAIVHLSLQEGALGRTFHLNNPRPLPPEEVLDVLESLGYRLRRLPAEEWGRKVREELRRDPDHPLGPFAPLFASTAPAGPETKKYDDRNTREGLAGSGIACPPVDPELLARALRFLIETGFLPPPPGEGAAVAASLRSSPSPYPPATPWA